MYAEKQPSDEDQQIDKFQPPATTAPRLNTQRQWYLHDRTSEFCHQPFWLLPSGVNKVDYLEVNDINFASMKTRKKQLDRCLTTGENVGGQAR